MQVKTYVAHDAVPYEGSRNNSSEVTQRISGLRDKPIGSILACQNTFFFPTYLLPSNIKLNTQFLVINLTVCEANFLDETCMPT